MYRPLHFVPSPSIKIERKRNDALTMEVAVFSKRQITYRYRQILGLSHLSERASFMFGQSIECRLLPKADIDFTLSKASRMKVARAAPVHPSDGWRGGINHPLSKNTNHAARPGASWSEMLLGWHGGTACR